MLFRFYLSNGGGGGRTKTSFFHVGKGERNSVKPKNYRFWFLSPASGWFVEWAFKQIMANMGRYHARHHVANPLIARPQSSYNKMIQPPDPSLSAQK